MKMNLGSVVDLKGYQSFRVDMKWQGGKNVYQVIGIVRPEVETVLAEGEDASDVRLMRDLFAVANARYRC